MGNGLTQTLSMYNAKKHILKYGTKFQQIIMSRSWTDRRSMEKNAISALTEKKQWRDIVSDAASKATWIALSLCVTLLKSQYERAIPSAV